MIPSLRAGACGYLLKDIPSEDLAKAIRLAHSGIYQLDSGVVGTLLGAQPQPQFQSIGEAVPLTAHELDGLRLLGKGATNQEIGDTLIISEGTVKKHISNILQTLNLRDRTQAAIYAIKHGVA